MAPIVVEFNQLIGLYVIGYGLVTQIGRYGGRYLECYYSFSCLTSVELYSDE